MTSELSHWGLSVGCHVLFHKILDLFEWAWDEANSRHGGKLCRFQFYVWITLKAVIAEVSCYFTFVHISFLGTWEGNQIEWLY